MMHTQRLAAMLACGLSAGLALGQGSIWFVDDDAPSGGDGTQWSTAFNTLDHALDAALLGDQVWVAAGVYSPKTMVDPSDLDNPTIDPRDATFFVRKGREVYGGFAGWEATLADRAGLFDQTILTGDITLADGTPGHARHVVFYFSEGSGPRGRLDGFVVRHGMAGQGNGFGGGGLLAGDLDGPDQNGYVWSVRVDVANCRFEDNISDNTGGGMYVAGPSHFTNTVFIGNASAGNGGGLLTSIFGAGTRLINCSFIDNTSGMAGGGFRSQSGGTGANPDVINCRFVGNTAGTKGGGISFSPNGNDAPMELFNTLIAHNTADLGAGMWLQGGIRINEFATIKAATATYGNCTFADNNAMTEGGGLFLGGDASDGLRAKANLYSSIVWGNRSPVGPQLSDGVLSWFSDVQGGWADGAGNLNVEPMFMDAFARDYRLMMLSPLVDSANSFFAATDTHDLDGDGNTAELIPFDLDGRRRFFDVPFVANTGDSDPAYMDYGAIETQPGQYDGGTPGTGNTVFLQR